MRSKKYDPLGFVPSPPVARKLLAESRALTRRLEILADLSEQLHAEQSQLAWDGDEDRKEADACLS